MKRFLLSVLLSLSVILVAPLSASAISAKTDITGNVTNNGNAVKHAQVTVVCNGYQKHDQTNNSGTYLVQFAARSARTFYCDGYRYEPQHQRHIHRHGYQ